jgi:hypothetical protein
MGVQRKSLITGTVNMDCALTITTSPAEHVLRCLTTPVDH